MLFRRRIGYKFGVYFIISFNFKIYKMIALEIVCGRRYKCSKFYEHFFISLTGVEEAVFLRYGITQLLALLLGNM